MIIKKFIKYLLIKYLYFFLHFQFHLNFFSRGFNEDILRLVFGFVVVFGSFTTFGSIAGSVIGSRVGILSKIFLDIIFFKAMKTFFCCTKQ